MSGATQDSASTVLNMGAAVDRRCRRDRPGRVAHVPSGSGEIADMIVAGRSGSARKTHRPGALEPELLSVVHRAPHLSAVHLFAQLPTGRRKAEVRVATVTVVHEVDDVDHRLAAATREAVFRP